MSEEPALYLTEAEIVGLIDQGDAIDALEETLAAQGRGETIEIPKALGVFEAGASSLHSLGSAIPNAGLAGFKNWINTPRGAVAIMTVFDTAQGRLAGIIEAGSLGQLRTSAISGVATRWMADADADELALIGTGRQALMQAAAVAAVRKLRRMRVFSPTAAKRGAFVEAARATFGFAVEDSPSLEDAVRDAPIVTLVTRAHEPFLHAAMLARGAHLNAVGAILPANAEFAQDVFARVSLIAVDGIAGARRGAREFVDRFGDDAAAWASVRTLGDVIASGQGRPAGCDLTLFKAMGMGISDLALARIALRRAHALGIGRGIAAPQLATPRRKPDLLAAA